MTKIKNSETATSKTSKKSYTQKSSTTKVDDTDNSKNVAETLSKVKDKNARSNTSDYLRATALVAIMEPATESQKFSKKKPPMAICPSNKIEVLLDSGLDGDLYFLQKGTDNTFPYLKRQVPKSWHTSNGRFQTNGKANLRVKFFDSSKSREYFIQPDVVE